MVREVRVGDAIFGGGRPLVLIAGPCVIESLDHTLRTAETLKAITARLGIGLVFKASYDKANRTSVTSFRGPGIDVGLKMGKRSKEELLAALRQDLLALSPEARAALLLVRARRRLGGGRRGSGGGRCRRSHERDHLARDRVGREPRHRRRGRG